MGKKIEKEKPDIICVTGDMYTAKDEKGKQIALELLQELAKSYKVYFVNGEHDCDEKFIQNLKDNEVNVLDYKKEAIAIKNTKINLYGITNQYYSATFDLKNAFEINKEEYNILLAHISNFEEFEQFGIDLGYVVIGMAAVIIILFILIYHYVEIHMEDKLDFHF